jgi:putative Mg2+ transporter-C (MgtC) family protein
METPFLQGNPQVAILLNVFIAMIFGGLIGMERELARKPAGLRTLMLVAGASSMLVGLGDTLIERFSSQSYEETLRADPVRLVEAIITGISFLGAGTIFRSGKDDAIEGLTTAASILICCVIGIAVALCQYVLSAGVTFLAVVILRIGAALERKISTRR